MSYCILVLQNGETALMLAVRSECSAPEFSLVLATQRGLAEVVQLLIEAGANVNLRNQVARSLTKVLPYSSKACVSYCILVLQNGETALILAARGGHSEIVKALTEAGALRSEVPRVNIFQLRLNPHQNDQETALMLAARGGHAKTVRVLIEAGANVDRRNQVAILGLTILKQGLHNVCHIAFWYYRMERPPSCWLLVMDILRQSRH